MPGRPAWLFGRTAAGIFVVLRKWLQNWSAELTSINFLSSLGLGTSIAEIRPENCALKQELEAPWSK